MKPHRFLRTWFVAVAFAFVAAATMAAPQLGLQTWTCNRMTFEEVVAFAVKHEIRNLQLIAPKHIDPAASQEEWLRQKAVLENHGLHAYAMGVAGTSLNKEENRRLFELARVMGMSMIVVEPGDPAIWDNLEELVREYDIKLAIHNHGRGTVFGNPATVWEVLAERDPRIGVCLDVGWVTAAGYDAAAVFRDYRGRVFDVHFKDKKVQVAPDGSIMAVDTEIGQGSVNFAGLFAEIAQTDWSGVMAIETDSRAFQSDPNAMVASARMFFADRDTLAATVIPVDPTRPHPKTGNALFFEKHESFLARAKAGPIGVLFLGDSITRGWADVPEVWEENYGHYEPANFGIGGDQTQHVLWRIANGELEGISPRVVVLMIGTNNSRSSTAEQIVAANREIVRMIREKLPATKVLLLAIFPRGPRNRDTFDAWETRREVIRKVNTELASFDDGENVRFLDLGPAFLAPDGSIPADIMPDQLHLSRQGYEIWAEHMRPLLEEMLR